MIIIIFPSKWVHLLRYHQNKRHSLVEKLFFKKYSPLKSSNIMGSLEIK